MRNKKGFHVNRITGRNSTYVINTRNSDSKLG